ncbi:hypothetical protein [Lamprocystis purpurea]|uniref:hypothetical protein n=1 Tax=Lamprocystis purpurea TaxID=61598 RepID=UPI000363FF4E|nr:hypothetical protein [Lamprocystis purpurea]
MISNSFSPSSEAGQSVWLANFSLKFPAHGPVCRIGADEITSTVGEVDYYVWMLQCWHPAIQRHAKEATAYKLLMGSASQGSPLSQFAQFPDPPPLPGIPKRLFNLITHFKGSASDNESSGHDLDMTATPDATEHPILELTVTTGLGTAGPNSVLISKNTATTASGSSSAPTGALGLPRHRYRQDLILMSARSVSATPTRPSISTDIY